MCRKFALHEDRILYHRAIASARSPLSAIQTLTHMNAWRYMADSLMPSIRFNTRQSLHETKLPGAADVVRRDRTLSAHLLRDVPTEYLTSVDRRSSPRYIDTDECVVVIRKSRPQTPPPPSLVHPIDRGSGSVPDSEGKFDFARSRESGVEGRALLPSVRLCWLRLVSFNLFEQLVYQGDQFVSVLLSSCP